MDRAEFDAITRAAGVEPTTSEVHFVGDGDPIYPSPLRLSAGISTILGNIAGVVDTIRHQQTGRHQTAEINLGQAVVGISSLWALKIDGELAYQPSGSGFPPGDGIFPTRDGRYLYLLSSFPHLIQRTLDVLNCTVEDLAGHVAAHDAADLEDKLVQAQLPGVMVRTPEEWNAHPQGKLLADSPTVIIERIGDAPPIPVPGGELPLNGVRVLDNTRILAGPVNGRTLAALGADVLHVGSPHVPDGVSSQADTGHGKRRAYIDLQTADGMQTMWSLIDGADVFSQSYRARSLDRRGLSPAALAERRPGIIYVSENAFGQFGPWREKRGYDHTVQAACGLHHITHDDPTRQFVH
ncbi:MAG: CoA transferase, partial [Chloroflexi bacterium]|nr:CoA transferase [Chloroflexota bacterium]